MDQWANKVENSEIIQIPNDIPLTNINLPNQWILYLYDKQLFKKMANRPNFQAKPHKELCTIKTVNDLIYILQLMEVKAEKNSKTNLDMNDYIIMRKGIEPIWEDPKNFNGGTFTIKMAHSKGYEVWSLFIMYMLGETLTNEMENINGITVSYIPDQYPAVNSNNSYTYIKIWDAKAERTRDQFVNILPTEILNRIIAEDISLQYSWNNKKRDFNDKNIINKLTSQRNNYGRERGGFITRHRGRRY